MPIRSLADVYGHGFRDRETVRANHNNAGYFVESADRQLHCRRLDTTCGSGRRRKTYSYNITVRNTGTLTATNVLLRDVLPDSVINAGDTLSFAIGDLLPSASSTISVNPTVVSDLPFTPFRW